MLNFRKLRQDFPSNVLKEGKQLFEKQCVTGAKIVLLEPEVIRLACRVKGAFDHLYESEIEINRIESIAIDSNCDCTYNFDCQHIAALLFYLEEKIHEIIVTYSTQAHVSLSEKIDDDAKEELHRTFAEAKAKEGMRKDMQYQKELLADYKKAYLQLCKSPFFLKPEILEVEKAELAIILSPATDKKEVEFQIALRLQARSKPLLISDIKEFLDGILYREPIVLSSKRYFFTGQSFSQKESEILHMVIDYARVMNHEGERLLRFAQMDSDHFGSILARAYDLAMIERSKVGRPDEELILLAPFYCGSLEEPLFCATNCAQIQFALEYLKEPYPSLFLKPSLEVGGIVIEPEQCQLYDAGRPGLLYENTYFRFKPKIGRQHLHSLKELRNIAICEPLFGSFIENSLPELRSYAHLTNPEIVKQFVTLPFVGSLKGRCHISYLNSELEATLVFMYDGIEINAAPQQLKIENITPFLQEEGILARNLVEERKILEACFEGFLYDEKQGVYRLKSEKKIVEFMTETIPKFQDQITFDCPENLADQFIYDDSQFAIHLVENKSVDSYTLTLSIDGHLKGTRIDVLWDCISAGRRFVELKNTLVHKKFPRILVLDLEKLMPLIQIFDDLGIEQLTNHSIERPLWSLVAVDIEKFASLPMQFSISPKLEELRKQILGEKELEPITLSRHIKATLRNYQEEGVQWLTKLRKMYLSGILADDMGLGKSLQAICVLTAMIEENPHSCSLIICPTSLVYNWKEEFHKFNSNIKVKVIDSVPAKRQKELMQLDTSHVVITSYNLLQKDIDVYASFHFDYVILDEAQHIKNRTTRNAKSVKRLKSHHRLILTGTPIENSLDELWSLFDFLMPGLLSQFDRFVEKYMRGGSMNKEEGSRTDALRRKLAPFILRRMKADVLDDLPPVSEIMYHCHLSEKQMALYTSYAASAKEELSKLVKAEGFDKIHIHVLATLTRLKQICCHPAIFAKESPELGDSAKYDMLIELLLGLIESKHKTVIFSQYTKMLGIIREDLNRKGISFAYLDGSSKNRLEIVKQFNEDPSILVFLVSLKAGGVGLNLTSADTVIHYDMWWNPAVENQATDRVHRIGQKKSVSSYKLITLNTIEEKILRLQDRKKGLVKKVIHSDDEAIAKLTWEEVLELLQT